MKDNTTKKKSNNRKTKKKYIDCYEQPIYSPAKLYVCKNCTVTDIEKHFYNCTLDLVDDTWDAYCLCLAKDKKTGDCCNIIVLKDIMFTYSKASQIGILAHEAFHAAHGILRYCGVSLNDSSEESYAYMIGWITECVYKTYEKK